MSPRGSAAWAAVALLTLAACRREPPTPLERLVAATHPSGVKVLLVGIDGATLRLIGPLADHGDLPEFARLIKEGAYGHLRSERPTRSPALWTTIATGRRRADHGITDFTLPAAEEGEEPILVSSRERRALALWNLLGPFGKKVGFLGWWATWPAEPVNGWMVSDRVTRGRWSEWTDGGRSAALTYPPELAEELRPLVVDPMHPPMDEIANLMDLTPAERRELLAVRRPIFAHGLSVFKFAYCSQRSYERMAEHLLAAGQPDLTGVFLIANDPISHTFWHFYEPRRFRGVDPRQAARLGRLIPNFYRHNDRFLGRLRELVDPETVIIVVSDHGFEASGRMPERKPAEEFADWFEERQREALADGTVAVGQSGRHAMDGVFLAAGGPVRAGVEVQASIYDVAPTVLALLGLPVPDDLPGKVLEEALEPEFLARHPIQRIPTYAGLIPLPLVEAEGDPEAEETLDMLRSLGYLQ